MKMKKKLSFEPGETNLQELTETDGHFFTFQAPFTVPRTILGIADRGDLDNVFDICLQLTGAEIATITASNMKVKPTCDKDTLLYYPRGVYGSPCKDTVW